MFGSSNPDLLAGTRHSGGIHEMLNCGMPDIGSPGSLLEELRSVVG